MTATDTNAISFTLQTTSAFVLSVRDLRSSVAANEFYYPRCTQTNLVLTFRNRWRREASCHVPLQTIDTNFFYAWI